MPKKSIKRLVAAFSVLIFLGVGGMLTFQSIATPLVRKDVDRKVFTIGDGGYKQALVEGKNVVKFGRLPWGMYAGGVAFDEPQAARRHLRENRKVDSEWGVYELSGDFELDTYETNGCRYTNKSLLVIRHIEESQSQATLEYAKFDQTLNSGWRILADNGEFENAAKSIEQYIESHAELSASQTRNLRFHAGQMYAYCDRYENAKAHFLASLMETESPDSPVKWNAYVNSTIAFLDGDVDKLNAFRSAIANGQEINGQFPNLKIVDAMLDDPAKTYGEIYEPFRGHPN